MMKTGNTKEEMQEEILWEIGEGLSAPPSAEPQAQTAAEAGAHSSPPTLAVGAVGLGAPDQSE